MSSREAALGTVLGGLLIPLVSCSSGPEELTPAEWLDQNTVVLQKLESYDPRERHEAISRFKKLGKERGTQVALLLLHDRKLENYRIEVVLARILADWRDPRAIAFLIDALKESDRGAVEIAKEGLAVFRNDADVIRTLEEMAEAPGITLRRNAAEVLSRMGDERTTDYFMRRYPAETDTEVRLLFLMSVVESRHPRRRSFLVDVLTDADLGLRRYAWDVLKREPGIPAEARFDPSDLPADRARQIARLRLSLEK